MSGLKRIGASILNILLIGIMDIVIAMDKLEVMGISILAICCIGIASAVVAIPSYFLWNWLMPVIFGIKTITFFQAWAITFLQWILFRIFCRIFLSRK